MNGWTNRETWLVSLWHNPKSVEDLEYIKELLEDQLESLGNCCLADMIDLQSINWIELEDYVKEMNA